MTPEDRALSVRCVCYPCIADAIRAAVRDCADIAQRHTADHVEGDEGRCAAAILAEIRALLGPVA